MINIKEVEYLNFGKCIAISNDYMEVFVTIDLGPRIIKCNLSDRENLMFTDPERVFNQDVSETFGIDKIWYIYGGHRMWVSPENMPLSYYPDNDKVIYTLTSNGAIFTPPPQKINNVSHEIEIIMCDDKPQMNVVHRLKNVSDKAITGAVWCLSVMDRTGVAVIQQPQEDTELLGNRILALWPYTDMSDERVFWGENYIALKQIPRFEKKFKLGINNTSGWIAYINHGYALVKSYSPNHPDGRYPDFGVSTELFTNEFFLEAETLSELCDIQPNETISHTETWTLVDNVQKPLFDNESLKTTAETLCFN